MNLNNQNEYSLRMKRKKSILYLNPKKFVFFECDPQRNYEKGTKGGDDLCVNS